MTPLVHEAIGLLEDRVVVVTGAGNGIGSTVAQVCVHEGAKVLASDISGLAAVVAEDLGTSAVAFKADIRIEAEVAAMFDCAISTYGRVDAAIHIAGDPGSRRAEEISGEEFDQITDVHLRGTYLCCKHALRVMLPAGRGSIVNFSSVASLNSDDRISLAYSAAKAGINSLTKSLAIHHGKDNIRVNAVLPGFTLSEKNRAAPPEALAAMRQRAVFDRGAAPEEQAQVAAFLASDRASFVTGAVIPVDGGWSARLA